MTSRDNRSYIPPLMTDLSDLTAEDDWDDFPEGQHQLVAATSVNSTPVRARNRPRTYEPKPGLLKSSTVGSVSSTRRPSSRTLSRSRLAIHGHHSDGFPTITKLYKGPIGRFPTLSTCPELIPASFSMQEPPLLAMTSDIYKKIDARAKPPLPKKKKEPEVLQYRYVPARFRRNEPPTDQETLNGDTASHGIDKEAEASRLILMQSQVVPPTGQSMAGASQVNSETSDDLPLKTWPGQEQWNSDTNSQRIKKDTEGAVQCTPMHVESAPFAPQQDPWNTITMSQATETNVESMRFCPFHAEASPFVPPKIARSDLETLQAIDLGSEELRPWSEQQHRTADSTSQASKPMHFIPIHAEESSFAPVQNNVETVQSSAEESPLTTKLKQAPRSTDAEQNVNKAIQFHNEGSPFIQVKSAKDDVHTLQSDVIGAGETPDNSNSTTHPSEQRMDEIQLVPSHVEESPIVPPQIARNVMSMFDVDSICSDESSLKSSAEQAARNDNAISQRTETEVFELNPVHVEESLIVPSKLASNMVDIHQTSADESPVKSGPEQAANNTNAMSQPKETEVFRLYPVHVDESLVVPSKLPSNIMNHQSSADESPVKSGPEQAANNTNATSQPKDTEIFQLCPVHVEESLIVHSKLSCNMLDMHQTSADESPLKSGPEQVVDSMSHASNKSLEVTELTRMPDKVSTIVPPQVASNVMSMSEIESISGDESPANSSPEHTPEKSNLKTQASQTDMEVTQLVPVVPSQVASNMMNTSEIHPISADESPLKSSPAQSLENNNSMSQASPNRLEVNQMISVHVEVSPIVPPQVASDMTVSNLISADESPVKSSPEQVPENNESMSHMGRKGLEVFPMIPARVELSPIVPPHLASDMMSVMEINPISADESPVKSSPEQSPEKCNSIGKASTEAMEVIQLIPRHGESSSIVLPQKVMESANNMAHFIISADESLVNSSPEQVPRELKSMPSVSKMDTEASPILRPQVCKFSVNTLQNNPMSGEELNASPQQAPGKVGSMSPTTKRGIDAIRPIHFEGLSFVPIHDSIDTESSQATSDDVEVLQYHLPLQLSSEKKAATPPASSGGSEMLISTKIQGPEEPQFSTTFQLQAENVESKSEGGSTEASFKGQFRDLPVNVSDDHLPLTPVKDINFPDFHESPILSCDDSSMGSSLSYRDVDGMQLNDSLVFNSEDFGKMIRELGQPSLTGSSVKDDDNARRVLIEEFKTEDQAGSDSFVPPKSPLPLRSSKTTHGQSKNVLFFQRTVSLKLLFRRRERKRDTLSIPRDKDEGEGNEEKLPIFSDPIDETVEAQVISGGFCHPQVNTTKECCATWPNRLKSWAENLPHKVSTVAETLPKTVSDVAEKFANDFMCSPPRAQGMKDTSTDARAPVLPDLHEQFTPQRNNSSSSAARVGSEEQIEVCYRPETASTALNGMYEDSPKCLHLNHFDTEGGGLVEVFRFGAVETKPRSRRSLLCRQRQVVKESKRWAAAQKSPSLAVETSSTSSSTASIQGGSALASMLLDKAALSNSTSTEKDKPSPRPARNIRRASMERMSALLQEGAQLAEETLWRTNDAISLLSGTPPLHS